MEVADQRMSALHEANKRRYARAELKRRMARGEASLIGVLADPAPEIRGMRIGELLEAVPAMGPKKSARALSRVRISSRTKLLNLDPVDKVALALYLRERCPEIWRRQLTAATRNGGSSGAAKLLRWQARMEAMARGIEKADWSWPRRSR